jgi:pyruvate/2-oxoglutarate dehydrogenase complex dihydrolipoamide acyltransferase (E2) component
VGQLIYIEKWAENLEEVTLLEWLKHEGESVSTGESLCVIVTEKVTFEYEMPFAGVVGKLYCPEGSTLPVGYAIAWVSEAEEPPPPEALEENAGLMLEYRDRLKIEFNEGEEMGLPAAREERVPASPAARRLARESGADLGEIFRRRGGEERLSEADVRAYLDQETE